MSFIDWLKLGMVQSASILRALIMQLTRTGKTMNELEDTIMRRFGVLFITLMLFFGFVAHAESGDHFAVLSSEEVQQRIAAAESQPQPIDEELMQSAIQVLIEYWTDEVYAESYMENSDGYLEILAAQVTYVQKDFAVQEEFASSFDAMFENVYCVIDFAILSDYFDTAPYYWDVGINNCVVIYRDGTIQVSGAPLFNMYRSKSFNNDFSAIIEKVERYDVGKDNIYYLTAE